MSFGKNRGSRSLAAAAAEPHRKIALTRFRPQFRARVGLGERERATTNASRGSGDRVGGRTGAHGGGNRTAAMASNLAQLGEGERRENGRGFFSPRLEAPGRLVDGEEAAMRRVGVQPELQAPMAAAWLGFGRRRRRRHRSTGRGDSRHYL